MRGWSKAGARWPQPDFLAKRAHPPALAWAWLVCGALLLALAVDEWSELETARSELQRQTERLRLPPRARPVTAAPAPRPEAAQAAQRLVQRLDHPWRTFFEATERHAAVDVHWLRLEHDAERGDVRLEALAPNREAMLRTLDALAAAPRWSELLLLRVEAAPFGQRFELRARHGGTPMADPR